MTHDYEIDLDRGRPTPARILVEAGKACVPKDQIPEHLRGIPLTSRKRIRARVIHEESKPKRAWDKHEPSPLRPDQKKALKRFE